MTHITKRKQDKRMLLDLSLRIPYLFLKSHVLHLFLWHILDLLCNLDWQLQHLMQSHGRMLKLTQEVNTQTLPSQHIRQQIYQMKNLQQGKATLHQHLTIKQKLPLMSDTHLEDLVKVKIHIQVLLLHSIGELQVHQQFQE